MKTLNSVEIQICGNVMIGQYWQSVYKVILHIYGAKTILISLFDFNHHLELNS